jgi:hypothetical protein
MNWRKGLFRLWVVGSGLWVSLIGWAAHADYTNPIRMMQEHCARYYLEHGSEGLCFAPPAEIIPFEQVAHWYIAIAIVPPALVMWVGVAALRARTSSRMSPGSKRGSLRT